MNNLQTGYSRISTNMLLLTCIAWGVLLGGVTYSHMVFMPVYLSNLPESSSVVNGPFAINEQIFWMTIHPIILISLILSVILTRKNRARRNLIVITLSIYILILIITALHFVPELLQFQDSLKSSLPASEWRDRGHSWMRWSIVRGVVLFLLAVPLFKALSMQEPRKFIVEI